MTTDQPNTEPVAYSDGKGTLNLHCLTCPRRPEATTALSVNDIDHWDQCRACRRYVVDVAREAAADRSRACTWPTCLTPDQHTELAAQVTAEEHGEHRPAMPDQRAVCGCSEAACHCGLGTRAQCATKAWGCGPGSTDPNTEPAPAPVDPALQQRVAAAIRAATCNGDCAATEEECVKRRIQPVVWHYGVLAEVSGTPEQIATAVLAELAPELARAQFGDRTRQELADLAVNAANALRDEKRHYRIACQEIARLRAQLDRIRQMVDAWERQLPDTIRIATAVDAIRTALTPAAEGSQS